MAKISVSSLAFTSLEIFKGFAFGGGGGSFSVFGGLVFFGFAEISVCPSVQRVGFQIAAPRAGLLSCVYHLLQPFIFSGLFSGPSDKGGQGGRKE